jgi:hypothetical protein
MGGQRSTRWRRHQKKSTVEECRAGGRVLDITCWMFKPRQHTYGILGTSICYEIDTTNMATPRIRLSYTVGRQDLSYEILLEKTQRRWWWSCPRCRRRTGTLYRPPGEYIFTCRVCAGLTYCSSQQSHTKYAEYDRKFIQELAVQFPNIPIKTIKRTLKNLFG